MLASYKKKRQMARRFGQEEGGAISVLNLYFVMGIAVLGGIAVDTANLLAARNQLQIAADVAAHAAMHSRISNDVATAKAEALKIANANMPKGTYGDVLRAENVQFGTYDASTKVFTVDNSSTEAVWIETDRLRANSNSVSSFFLQLIGMSDFDVRTNAVFVGTDVPCMNDGFYANERIDMQSNNQFWNGFCVHSNSRVEMQNGNFFEATDGVVVMAPKDSDLVVPGGGWGNNNNGLSQAWHASNRRYKVDVEALIDEIITSIQTPGTPHYRPFVKNAQVVSWPPSGNPSNSNANNNNGKKKNGGGSPTSFTPSSLTKGRIHNVSCTGGTLDVGTGTYEDVVVITDCAFNMSKDVILDNSTFISTSKNSNGVLKAPSGFQIGRDDSCKAGGGAQLILKGSMKSAAKMKLFGGQIISAGDVKFAAQGNGFAGASVIAGGEIDFTSLAVMGLCEDGGKEDFFEFEDKGPPRLAG